MQEHCPPVVTHVCPLKQTPDPDWHDSQRTSVVVVELGGQVVLLTGVVVVVVVADVRVVVEVVVVVVAQPPALHASQQLASWPTHAVPPRGATHLAASRLIEQLV